MSHHDAARAHGIELVEDDGSHHATVPRNCARPRLAGWRVHRADIATVTTDSGLLVAGPLATVCGLARVLPLSHAVAAADSAVRQGLLELGAVTAALGAARGPGAGIPRRVAGLLDDRAGSVLESVLRVLIASAGLPAPRTQYEVRGAHGWLLARVDFCWPAARLVVEADGFAFHSDRAAYRNDRARMNELERLGWRVLRFTWEDVMSRPDHVVALIRECLALPVAA
jgi:hypothetical protein